MTRPERIAALRAGLREVERAVAGFRVALRESNLPEHQAFFPELFDRLDQIVANEREGASAELAGDLLKGRNDLRRLALPDIDPDLDAPTPGLLALRGARGNLVEALDNALDAARAIGLAPRMTEYGTLEVPRDSIREALIRLDERLRIVQENVVALREEASRADAARSNEDVSQRGLFNIQVRTLSVEVSAARFETRVDGDKATPKMTDLAALARTVEAIRDTARDVKAAVEGLRDWVAPTVAAIGRGLARAAERSWRGVRTVVGVVRRRVGQHEAAAATREPPPGFDRKEVKRMVLAGKAPPAHWVPFITELMFSGEALRDLSPLRDLTSMQTLWLTNTQVTDIDPLRGLTSLQELRLDNTQVSDIDPLRGLASLQSLSLANTQVSDIDPLRGLASLQTLWLDHTTQVSDIDPLRSLTSLQSLWLHNTQVSDIDPLHGLTSLEKLSLSGTQVSDIDPLHGLTSLEKLSLSGTQVSDIDPLRGLTSLQSLSLDNTQVSDIDPLRGLTSLQSLSLDNTQVSDIDPLRSLTSLQSLSANNTQVSDIDPLRGLTSLQDLRLDNTQVSDIDPLRGLTSLQSLSLDNTQVADIDPLRGLTSLQMLSLSKTHVSDIDALRGLTGLRKLEITDTRVSDLDPMREIISLLLLSIGGTPVTDLDPLRGLADLRLLDCGSAPVRDLAPLVDLRMLSVLRVRAEVIHDWRVFDLLSGLNYLYVDGQVPESLPTVMRSDVKLVFNGEDFTDIAIRTLIRSLVSSQPASARQ